MLTWPLLADEPVEAGVVGVAAVVVGCAACVEVVVVACVTGGAAAATLAVGWRVERLCLWRLTGLRGLDALAEPTGFAGLAVRGAVGVTAEGFVEPTGRL